MWLSNSFIEDDHYTIVNEVIVGYSTYAVVRKRILPYPETTVIIRILL